MEDHIKFDPDAMTLSLLDQRLLPGEIATTVCHTCQDTASAIANMVVRGAPAIGVTAAFGCVLALHSLAGKPDWKGRLAADMKTLRAARPTAVNLGWAIDRMASLLDTTENEDELRDLWLAEAQKIQEDDQAICRALGKIGSAVIADGDTVLTHCNAGALATAGHGTALGVIRSATEEGKKVRVIADETRPFMQGSRLTAWELASDGIPVKIACDNACAHLLAKGLVQLVITGADRIAANGDTANKIGTLGVAILAKYYHIPFYIAAPLSTIDPGTPNGAAIPIEERRGAELSQFLLQNTFPAGVDAFNFAFDVTPAELISGIITEVGILKPPYDAAIAAIFARRGNGA